MDQFKGLVEEPFYATRESTLMLNRINPDVYRGSISSREKVKLMKRIGRVVEVVVDLVKVMPTDNEGSSDSLQLDKALTEASEEVKIGRGTFMTTLRHALTAHKVTSSLYQPGSDS